MKNASIFRAMAAAGVLVFSLTWPSIKPAYAADVTNGLKLQFKFDSAPVNNLIVDTSPAGTHPGTNYFATWQAIENGRTGVVDFIAPIPNSITVPAIPALNSTQGTISFRLKTPGNSQLRGDYAA